MDQLSVESFTKLDDALIDEIGVSLAPDDPQLEMFAEQMAMLDKITATPSTYFIARHNKRFVGYASVHQRTPQGHAWLFDVILAFGATSQPDEVAAALFQCARNEVVMPVVEWWSRGPAVQVAQHVAPRFGLKLTRQINRMEMDVVAGQQLHPVPTRAFTIDDAEAIVRLNNEAFAHHADRANLSVARLMNDFELMGSRYEDLRILEDANGISGFVWVKPQLDRYGEIYVIALDRRHQGQGLGFHLLDAGINHLQEAYSPKRAMLYVESTNERAINLYNNYGFVDVSQPLIAWSD
jgi:mycothiol synthase